ncbi:MAG: ferredoxin [Puniceicoccales bacterium]|jgi:ferredoxin|nr:ferredoxin [Puniceicoccales bacterium]
MAERQNRWPQNAPGAYYVDDNCIDCDLCREIASDIFKREDSGGYSYVLRQPENEAERQLCREALESCPAGAIGADGAPAA